MRIEWIKKANERLPYWVKAPFSHIIRQKLIGNPVFLETYRELERADAMTPEELDAWQLRQLKEALRHAGEHTAYYRELFRQRGFDPESVSSLADLSALPVLTKDDLKARLEAMAADNLTDFYPVTTGGTTGAPTKVLMERDAIYREWAFVYHYWAKFGYDYKTSRLATFRGASIGKKFSVVNPLYREIRMNPFVMNRDNIGEYVKRIDRYKADFLYGYPSAVHNFCRLASEKGINLRGRFQAALLISENLYPFQEEAITAALDCPIAMFYGHSERAVFAERSEKGYAFHPLYGVTEIAQDGTPIVTGFINRKTPLIRYQVDDSAEAVDGNDRFQIVGHRNGDLLYGLHGEQISAAALNFHSDVFRRVSAYQYVQSEPGECVLKILSQETLKAETLKEIESQVNQKLVGVIHCYVEQTDSLYHDENGRGKYKMVIQTTPPRFHNLVNPPSLCARGFYRITGHRDGDLLSGRHGEQISVASMEFHSELLHNLRGYQIVQTEPGKCVLKVLADERLDRERLGRIEVMVNRKLAGAIRCTVEQTEELELTPRGKFKLVLRK